jgi:HSP20 family protein
MELMSKLKEIIPWKRKPVETHQVLSLRDDINRLFDRMLMAPFDFDSEKPSRLGGGLDIDETEQGVQARIEVPGLDTKQ